ncbi:FliM/FliN family flagellar motor switch protein [Fertoebacter nigrum]|uniref:FliM/FliN family flagellar motor switch protein n=2 Tax=Fertoeibacter niger TaxID=2656921 RepID=A0A8X8KM90_9RHOB|nr:FliM/FliN family flagellar motor C-terminal domain-containing protein [Fertoeibacter niger]NUB43670.1 FliM/FliN family flagellar motor switch protein [Fertoeibacter niger]
MAEQGGIRRKLAVVQQPAGPPASAAERGWPLALARAARDSFALGLEVTRLTAGVHSLAVLLELPPERALIAVLEGPGDALGLLVIAPGTLAAMTEVQTMGRVLPQPPLPRKPTRTDAAMVAGFIDAALADLETGLLAEADRVWASGFRYASFLDDARPLGLLLEDAAYRVLQAELALAEGVRQGQMLLALPASGRGQRPPAVVPPAVQAGAAQQFQAALALQVMASACVIEAVLCRLSLPLAQVMALAPGDVLALPLATVDRIACEGLTGQKLAEGRLGQHRGQRALRLALPGAEVLSGAGALAALPGVGQAG